jgi:DNA-binding PadR family transcriptional regulator
MASAPRPTVLGIFIRDYLLARGEAYPYEVYRAYKEAAAAAGRRPRTSWQNVVNYFFWLSRLGLIEPSRTEPPSNPDLKILRRYYRLTRKGLATPPTALEWVNPRRALYRESYERGH